MTELSSSVSGVAKRYATALFELAKDSKSLDQVEADLKSLQAMLDESEDLRRLVSSPLFSSEQQGQAMAAIADKAEIKGLVGNFVLLICANRRLFALPGMIRGFMDQLADERGEVLAEVISANTLSDDQLKALTSVLNKQTGKDVDIQARVDSQILGGLIVKVGSRMIDSSLRTKLNLMKTRLKEAS